MAITVHVDAENRQRRTSSGFSNPAITETPPPKEAKHIKGDPHAVEADSWDDPAYRKRWISIIMVYTIMFMTVFQGSVYWSSLWPFLSSIDPTADEAFMGYIIMTFNMARVISAPLLGWLSNRLDQTKLPILIGMAFVVVGNAGIVFLEAQPHHRKWLLLAARCVIGFGTGNAGPLFAYIIMASTVEERSTVITTRTAIASMGLILGPALQTVFVPIGYPGHAWGPFHLDMYTTPAFTCAIAGAIAFVIFAIFFEETWISVAKSERRDSKGDEEQLPPYDKLAVAVTILTKLMIMFCYSYDITLASPLSMLMFNWSSQEAVLYLGIIQVCGAVVCLFSSCFTGQVILQYVQERKVIIVGVFGFLLFFMSSFAWPGLPPLGKYTPLTVGGLNTTLSSISSDFNSSTTLDSRSTCNYSWCDSTTRIYVFQYVLGYFFMLLGWVLVQSGDGVLFSKLLGPRKQGTLSGIYQSGGKLGMSLSPLINSRLFLSFGPRVAWGVGSGLVVFNLLLLAVTYTRLLPFDVDPDYVTL